ncbi:metallophosphoesterase [Bosea sp. 117]|uniref:metallophosphoesterase n=1 Tax=Bosea sp. 117 TaxID=1125973 RepID=UPI000494C194|nr:metallophosphoesterase [Bosea sp. 117]
MARLLARPISRRMLLAGTVTTLTGGAAMAGYAGFVEPAVRLVVTTYRPRPATWPADYPLSVAVITDLHVGEPIMGLGRIEEIVARTNALAPDLVVLLGDYTPTQRLVTRPVPLDEAARALAALKAPLGVWSIMGNHDWWDDPVAQANRRGPTASARAMEAAGIPVLENKTVRIAHGGRHFWLAGLGDTIAFRTGEHNSFKGVDDLPGTLAQIEDDAPAILLAHEPDVFVDVPDRIALTLSGHTHGGQVRIAGWSPIVPSTYGNRFAYGHVVEDGRHLIVSGGLGCTSLPVRIGVPPEVVRVELGGAVGA